MVRYMDKVFKNGPSKICVIQPIKDLKGYGLQTYHFNFFKGCLPQILLGPFVNTLSHMIRISIKAKNPGCCKNLWRI